MPTEAQINANRLNALKSTGPPSPEGKARSSLNALKSGIDAWSHIIPGEDPAELEALTAAFHNHYQPAGPTHLSLLGPPAPAATAASMPPTACSPALSKPSRTCRLSRFPNPPSRPRTSRFPNQHPPHPLNHLHRKLASFRKVPMHPGNRRG